MFNYNYSKSADTDESLFILLIASPNKGAIVICLIFFTLFTSLEAKMLSVSTISCIFEFLINSVDFPDKTPCEI